jgi:uncharacterized protein
MNEELHIAENIKTAENSHPQSLTDEQLNIISEVKSVFRTKIRVGCTGCSYCMPCPTGVNIPLCFQLYNSKHFFDDKGFSTTSSQAAYLLFTSGADGNRQSYASLCKKCGKCEEKCPQSLPIREKLGEVARDMQPFYFKSMAKAFSGIVKMNMFLSRPPKNRSAATH